jgi:lipopolysaccharide transport system permease protein
MIVIKAFLEYKDFFWLSILRELRPKYRLPLLGFLWTVGQPLLSALVVSSFVGPRLVERLVRNDYFFFCWLGLSFWFFFSHSINTASTSLAQRVRLVKSSLVPRIYIILAPVFACLAELLVNLSLIFMLFLFLKGSSLHALSFIAILLALIQVLLCTTGLSLFLAALTAHFQDMKYVTSFILQIGFLLSPVIYEPNISSWKAQVFYLNPVAFSIKLSRWAFGIQSAPSITECFIGLGISLTCLVLGAMFFQSQEKHFTEFL